MELFQSDISLLKDKEIVYFSLGEDFDINSFYSEYKMDKQLGAGGFGRVMLATSRVNGQKVAIKATHNDSVDSVRDLDGLFTEAQTLKALKHPNIVQMLNCFVDRKTRQAIMIMEYLEGGELTAILQEKGRLSEAEAVDIFNQLLSAITYCHRYKVIHRDLKPENIIRATQEGNCFKVGSSKEIVDFGIAGLFAGLRSEVTNAGSLYYMPPELLSKKNVVASPALDVWALGCILYSMVVGKLPFRGDNPDEIKKKIIKEKHSFPSEIELTPEVKDLIDRMLEKEPEKRASVYEISDHSWSNKRSFTPEEKAKIKERQEAELVLQAQRDELQKPEESQLPASKKSSSPTHMTKKPLIPSSERTKPSTTISNSSWPNPKKPKDPVIQVKELEKEGSRKQSVNRANVK
jgi:serine/threonine protein kinase